MADRHFHWTGETNNTWQGANWRDENGDLIDHGGHGPGWAIGKATRWWAGVAAGTW